uniref:AlNc14C13G1579 protein n=1 Tax=Albugo laibachii Nc14 TaxID=890382 RepID=F0W3L8_9STRA|nr:AlNc14C13G1579 [Albugo laibachii Nc14]CCA16275.1 AlNc14C20G2054 [Albugo laibachii Nc14]|eukprot:CCA16275.1 AlNc14C20G2054 [Albugo laibachii Nc14]
MLFLLQLATSTIWSLLIFARKRSFIGLEEFNHFQQSVNFLRKLLLALRASNFSFVVGCLWYMYWMTELLSHVFRTEMDNLINM